MVHTGFQRPPLTMHLRNTDMFLKSRMFLSVAVQCGNSASMCSPLGARAGSAGRPPPSFSEEDPSRTYPNSQREPARRGRETWRENLQRCRTRGRERRPAQPNRSRLSHGRDATPRARQGFEGRTTSRARPSKANQDSLIVGCRTESEAQNRI